MDDIDIGDVHTFDGSSTGWVNAVDPPQPSSPFDSLSDNIATVLLVLRYPVEYMFS